MSMDEEPLTDLTGQEAPEKEEFHICTEYGHENETYNSVMGGLMCKPLIIQ